MMFQAADYVLAMFILDHVSINNSLLYVIIWYLKTTDIAHTFLSNYNPYQNFIALSVHTDLIISMNANKTIDHPLLAMPCKCRCNKKITCIRIMIEILN